MIIYCGDFLVFLYYIYIFIYFSYIFPFILCYSIPKFIAATLHPSLSSTKSPPSASLGVIAVIAKPGRWAYWSALPPDGPHIQRQVAGDMHSEWIPLASHFSFTRGKSTTWYIQEQYSTMCGEHSLFHNGVFQRNVKASSCQGSQHYIMQYIGIALLCVSHLKRRRTLTQGGAITDYT